MDYKTFLAFIIIFFPSTYLNNVCWSNQHTRYYRQIGKNHFIIVEHYWNEYTNISSSILFALPISWRYISAAFDGGHFVPILLQQIFEIVIWKRSKKTEKKL